MIHPPQETALYPNDSALPFLGKLFNPRSLPLLQTSNDRQFVVIASSRDPSIFETIEPTADVTLVGPEGYQVPVPGSVSGQTEVNPNGNWGVDQMVVGFNQELADFTAIATYEFLVPHLTNNLGSSVPLRDTMVGETLAWYVKGSAPFAGQLLFNAPLSGGAAQIQVSDAPSLGIPAYYLQLRDSTSYELLSVLLDESFAIDVSAGVRTNAQHAPFAAVVGNTYTIEASAMWDWDGSGSFNGLFVYAPGANTGISRPTAWSFVMVGGQFPANLRLANDVLHASQWLPL